MNLVSLRRSRSVGSRLKTDQACGLGRSLSIQQKNPWLRTPADVYARKNYLYQASLRACHRRTVFGAAKRQQELPRTKHACTNRPLCALLFRHACTLLQAFCANTSETVLLITAIPRSSGHRAFSLMPCTRRKLTILATHKF